MAEERKRSFLSWVRDSLLGHMLYLQLVWIVPLIILVVQLRVFGRPQTMLQLFLFILPILISGMFFVYLGWLRSGPRSSRNREP
ncbi:MAG: hypothetical protein QNI99_11355 [Woeseiaceae bacterium]|nr:hypothetical protein [Woeseiaceae bacterium]